MGVIPPPTILLFVAATRRSVLPEVTDAEIEDAAEDVRFAAEARKAGFLRLLLPKKGNPMTKFDEILGCIAYLKLANAVRRGEEADAEADDEEKVGSIEELIQGSDIVLVGNRYDEAINPLQAAMGDRPMVDLTRITPGQRSDALYQGICW